MTKAELLESLNYVNGTRYNRQETTELVLDNPGNIAPLMEIAFEDRGSISSKACWILEFIAKKDLKYILMHTDSFIHGISKVHLDSSVRPIAKICEILMKVYFSSSNNDVRDSLKDDHLKRITSCCFDWLIGDHKVAAKAYSMSSLYLLGEKFEWIRPELKLVLEQNFYAGSAAYKARARQILALIKKNEKLSK
ncbi:adenylosuccinate lyase [uncultured Eudoraea sp.]|uniref:adenylosuccinate lyase n=1 Tax=uncultured Eudoraea sp. TaxID=1035614 RepID=UPI0026143E33|nr:adenylosuccinate lyase [uncultured Eudoraea sp.]